MGVTQTAICKGTGISDTGIGKWLKGERNLKDENVGKVTAWLEEFKKQVAEI